MADKKNEFDDVPENRMPKVNLAPKKDKANLLAQTALALGKRYEFRFNTITRSYEIKESKDASWRWLEDRDLKNIHAELKLENLPIGKDELSDFIKSKYISEDYNPFKDFIFNRCPKWDGKTDWIDLFLRQVTLIDEKKEREVFTRFFTKWFTGLVVNTIEDERANQQCFVIIGRQGIFKTTWLHSMIPAYMRLDYLYSGQFDFENKDHKKYCAFKILIDLDELSGFSKADHNSLKSVMTDPKVELRLPYAEFDTRAWRRASFCGSSNNAQFLSDETGSRRFLPFNVANIKIDKSFPIENMYGQALALYKSGWQYWFDQKDEAEVSERNKEFHNVSIEEDLILTHLKIPTEQELNEKRAYVDYLNASEINIYLASFSNKININETTKYRTGSVLQKLGFKLIEKRINKKPRRVYPVIKVEKAEISDIDEDNNVPPQIALELEKNKPGDKQILDNLI